MALIPTRPTVESRGRITFKPKESNLETFRAYAEMLTATDDPDYVFDMIAERVLSSDPEFIKFRADHPQAGVIKKAGSRAPRAASAQDSQRQDPAKSKSNGADKSLTNSLRVGANA